MFPKWPASWHVWNTGRFSYQTSAFNPGEVGLDFFKEVTMSRWRVLSCHSEGTKDRHRWDLQGPLVWFDVISKDGVGKYLDTIAKQKTELIVYGSPGFWYFRLYCLFVWNCLCWLIWSIAMLQIDQIGRVFVILLIVYIHVKKCITCGCVWRLAMGSHWYSQDRGQMPLPFCRIVQLTDCCSI